MGQGSGQTFFDEAVDQIEMNLTHIGHLMSHTVIEMSHLKKNGWGKDLARLSLMKQ